MEARLIRFVEKVTAILRDVDKVCRDSVYPSIDFDMGDAFYAHALGVKWDGPENRV